MKLTPKIIENIYSMLYCVQPFASWDMPLPQEIKFIVDSDVEAMGTYLYSDDEDYASHYYYFRCPLWAFRYRY